MNLYKIIFMLSGKRKSQTVSSENYGKAEKFGKKVVQAFKKETGKPAYIISIDRLYKVDKKGDKGADRFADASNTVMGFLSGLG